MQFVFQNFAQGGQMPYPNVWGGGVGWGAKPKPTPHPPSVR